MRNFLRHGLALLALCATWPAWGAANDAVNERLTASACQPVSPEDRASLVLGSAGWSLASGFAGQAFLHCPILTPYQDETYGQRHFAEFRMWYRVPDPDAQINASLLYRLSTDSSWSGVGNVHSSDNPAVGYTTQAEVYNPVLLLLDAQYAVEIVITRWDATTATPTFKGVSFKEKP